MKLEKRLIIAPMILFVLMIVAGPVAAEDEKPPFEWKVFFGPGGGVNMSIGDMNDYLDDAGYDQFQMGMGIGGGGFLGNYNHWVFGLEGYRFAMGSDVKRNDWDVDLSGQYFLLRFGYAAVQKNGWQFYPMIGLGGGSSTLTISNSKADTSFEYVLLGPRRSTTMSNGYIVLDAALAFDYRFSFFENNDGTRAHGLVLGAKLGYSYTPYNTNWELSGADIEGGPDFGVNGPYLKFVIGWGGGDSFKK